MSARDLTAISIPLTRGTLKYLRRLVVADMKKRDRNKRNQDARRGGAFVPQPGHFDAHLVREQQAEYILADIDRALGDRS